MPEDINEETGQGDQMDNAGEGDQRSQKRFQDLANKVSTLAREKEDLAKQHETEKTDLLQKQKDLEFKVSFSEVGSKYPAAKEFEADIKAKVASGYSIDDAIISTLASKGKLETAPPSKIEVMGGSADTQVRDTSKKDPSFGGDIVKMREEVLRLEKEGEIGLKF